MQENWLPWMSCAVKTRNKVALPSFDKEVHKDAEVIAGEDVILRLSRKAGNATTLREYVEDPEE